MAFIKDFLWFYKTFPRVCVWFWGFHGLPRDCCSVQHTFPKKEMYLVQVPPTGKKIRCNPGNYGDSTVKRVL